MSARQKRRERVLELIARNEITSQEQLQELLRVEGFVATQATISRDLRDLGITKGPRGYVQVTLDSISETDARELRDVLRAHLTSVDRAGTLLVLRTEFGHARAMAMKIDHAGLPQCVGTVAGDDTLFIATRSAGQAGELSRMLQRLTRR